MIVFGIITVILILLIVVVSTILLIKLNKASQIRTIQTLYDILQSRSFKSNDIINVNKHLAFAISQDYSMLAMIENFNPNNPMEYNYQVVGTSFISAIEKKGSTILLTYLKQGEKIQIRIYPAKKTVVEFFYDVYKHANLKRIEKKYPNFEPTISSSCDWQSSYVWAFSAKNAEFAYYKTFDKQYYSKIDLKKEHFTIDTKYKYFEAPVMGIAQQLFIYENDFLDNLYQYMFDIIKQKCSVIVSNKLYYDSYNNIVYLSNGLTSLQSIILDEVEEFYYKENRLVFALYNSDKNINFMTDYDLIQEFREFITTFNLRKIAQNFDYQTDKLLNATENTKFIVDYSRDRLVYCACLDSIARFSYIIIPYANLVSATVEKSGNKNFVRINTNDNETIDVTCKKYEVAQYIQAQIMTIIDQI